MTVEEKISKAREENANLLNLADLGLEEIPSTINELVSLKILNLRNNRIKEISSLEGLENLNVIYLDNNQIEQIAPQFFDTINLTVLNLANNLLDKIPDSISKQTKLKRLFLSSNSLSYLPEVVFELKELEVLAIGNNDIKVISRSINNLEKLKVFRLNRNQIDSVDIDFSKMKSLAEVDLSENKLSEFTSNIKEAEQLKRLHLYSNNLQAPLDFSGVDLRDCVVNLGDNRIEEVFFGNGRLKELHLYFNPLMKNHLKEFIQVEIESIFIDNNQVDNFIINDKTVEALKVINNSAMQIKEGIYKAIPQSIEEKYGLKSRYQLLLEKMRKGKMS